MTFAKDPYRYYCFTLPQNNFKKALYFPGMLLLPKDGDISIFQSNPLELSPQNIQYNEVKNIRKYKVNFSQYDGINRKSAFYNRRFYFVDTSNSTVFSYQPEALHENGMLTNLLSRIDKDNSVEMFIKTYIDEITNKLIFELNIYEDNSKDRFSENIKITKLVLNKIRPEVR